MIFGAGGYFGAQCEQERQWFVADGKEIRGSMSNGEKRGEVMVQTLRHGSGEIYGQAFYNGKKESDRPCILQLRQGRLGGQKITLDPLHLVPETFKKIADEKGSYLIGLKENQNELYQDIVRACGSHSPVNTFKEVKKGQPRIEKGTYTSYAEGKGSQISAVLK